MTTYSHKQDLVSTDSVGDEYVILRNPWGTTGPNGDGYSVETIQTL